MELNRELELKECLDILNHMLKFMDEWDCDTEGVIYISCSLKDIKELIKKMLPYDNDAEDYIEEFCFDYEDYGEDSSIDISPLWGEVCCKFNKDIWVNFKHKKFYISRFYHKAIRYIRQQYKRLKRNVKVLKFKLKYNKYTHEIKQRIKVRRLVRAYNEAERKLEDKNK